MVFLLGRLFAENSFTIGLKISLQETFQLKLYPFFEKRKRIRQNILLIPDINQILFQLRYILKDLLNYKMLKGQGFRL